MEELLRMIDLAVTDLIYQVNTIDDILNDSKRSALLKNIVKICQKLNIDVERVLPPLITDHYTQGMLEANALMIQAGVGVNPNLNRNAHIEAIQEITNATALDMRAAVRRAQESGLNFVEIALQNVQNEIAKGMLEGKNKKKIQKKVMEKFTSEGMTSFITSDGRQLPLDFYAKTVVRTKTKHAHSQGAVSRYIENGVKYGMVNEHHPTCNKCASRQGVIFRFTSEGDTSVPTVDEVGLPPYHPNCRHSVRPIVSLEGRTIKQFNPESDPRTPFQKRAYETEQRIRRKANAEKKAYAKLLQEDPTNAPRTLAGYRRRVRKNNEKWISDQNDFSAISKNIKSGKAINPQVKFAREDALTRRPDLKVTDPQRRRTILDNDYIKIDHELTHNNGEYKFKFNVFDTDYHMTTRDVNHIHLVNEVLNARNRKDFRMAFKNMGDNMLIPPEINGMLHRVFKGYTSFDTLFKVNGYDVALDRDMANSLGSKLKENQLSKSEISAFRLYSGSDYSVINGGLRHGRSIPTKQQKAIDEMDRAYERISLEEDLLLQRGSRWMPPEITSLLEAKDYEGVKGYILEDKGYMSTSISCEGKFGGQYEFQIEAPKGTKGIYIAQYSKYESEQEVLLNRGTKLRIKDVLFDEDEETYRFLMEIVQ